MSMQESSLQDQRPFRTCMRVLLWPILLNRHQPQVHSLELTPTPSSFSWSDTNPKFIGMLACYKKVEVDQWTNRIPVYISEKFVFTLMSWHDNHLLPWPILLHWHHPSALGNSNTLRIISTVSHQDEQDWIESSSWNTMIPYRNDTLGLLPLPKLMGCWYPSPWACRTVPRPWSCSLGPGNFDWMGRNPCYFSKSFNPESKLCLSQLGFFCVWIIIRRLSIALSLMKFTSL